MGISIQVYLLIYRIEVLLAVDHLFLYITGYPSGPMEKKDILAREMVLSMSVSVLPALFTRNAHATVVDADADDGLDVIAYKVLRPLQRTLARRVVSL